MASSQRCAGRREVAGRRLDQDAGPPEPVAQVRAAAVVDDRAAVGGDDLDRAVDVVHLDLRPARVAAGAVQVTTAVPEKS